MVKSKILYQEHSEIYAKYYHPQSDDFLEYKSTIQIKNSGKQPVVMKLKFDGIYPSFAPMPPEEHKIKAKDIIELYQKLNRWFGKFNYEVK
jgi:hypothetical protein